MPAAEMAAILSRILQRHGVAVLEDRRRTLGLLRDHAPSESRAVRLLMSAYDMDVPKNLAAEGGAPSQLKIDQEVNSLIADSGLQADLARWAVNVWSAALSGTAPASAAALAAVAPAAPAAAPAAPAADDLTWGDEAPAAPVAPTAAPPMAPAAPTYAPPPSPAAPAGAATLGQKPAVRYGLIAVALIATIFGVKSYLDSGETPTPPPVPSQPSTPNPPPAQPAQPAQPSAPAVDVASTSENVSDWPEFPGAAHPNNNPNDWQFQFNARVGDGRTIAYNVFVAMNANGRVGSGSVRALDVRYLNGSADMVSSTPSLSVARDLESNSKIYITRINTTSWTKNPSRAPDVCIIFSSGNQRAFNPDKGVFCVFDLQGNSCGSQKIGCGRL
jgi:hypothetical protein